MQTYVSRQCLLQQSIARWHLRCHTHQWNATHTRQATAATKAEGKGHLVGSQTVGIKCSALSKNTEQSAVEQVTGSSSSSSSSSNSRVTSNDYCSDQSSSNGKSKEHRQLATTSSSTSVPGRAEQWYAAVGLSALAAMICSIDRAAMSVALIPMSEEFNWSDSTKGAVNSAFFIGYTVTNLLGGYLASSIGAKQVLGWGVVLWSVFTITTPLAASSSLPVLLGNRAVMGAGEGVTFPCVQNVVKFWAPATVRSRALAFIYSGGQIGNIVALLTAPLIIKAFGWPALFQIYGSLGLLWMFGWQRLVSDPQQEQWQQQQQQQHELQGLAVPQQQVLAPAATAAAAAGQQRQPPLGMAAGQASSSGLQEHQALSYSQRPMKFAELPWRQFFTNRPFLGLLVTHSMFGIGYYVCLSWLPYYYYQEYGVDVKQSAFLSVLPWMLNALFSNTSGWLADGLTNNKVLTLTTARKVLQSLGSVCPALCLMYLAVGHGDEQLPMNEAVVLLTAALSMGGFQSAGFAANHQDISRRYAAVLFGITNAMSSLSGTCSVYATGLILEATSSWALVFELVSLFYLAGAISFVLFSSSEQQFE